ncbi:MAG: Re/Si-specific NAD(P)(+) transhydrogenase subunit alpha [Hyphomicrobiales bacterium]
MKIGVPKETRKHETRVAATPGTVKKLVQLGAEVAVESGAGAAGVFTDAAYEEAGASIAKGFAATVKGAEVVLKVLRPTKTELKSLGQGQALICMMSPHADHETVQACAEAGVDAFAMELMPRISRAQSMDVLSSQANLAGYKAVIDAAHHFTRAFPMMMTAAGTVAPAKVFVMGAGVAGLQAIATGRRLGAAVSATDVRAEVAEQVQSLGAKFVFIEGLGDAASEGGYARELSEEDRKKQGELVAEHIKTQDIVITTALIPGRPAPKLITKDMVESMKPGSIIVDLAAERGGNCALTKPGKTVTHKDVKILGPTNLAGELAGNATQLYARNLQNFVDLISKDGALNLDWDDEIVSGCGLIRDGEIVHPILKSR